MIRKSTLALDKANIGKLHKIDALFDESKRVINEFIDILWEQKKFKTRFVDFKIEDTWLSARMQQCLGKQALEIVKSQRKRKNKKKPTFHRETINLDSRFMTFLDKKNSFDFWVKLSCIGKKIKIFLPSKRHRHLNSFKDWKMKRSARLRKRDQHYEIDVYFEVLPVLKTTGKTVGVDVGYKKFAVLSDGQVVGRELEKKIEKISRKQQKSKAFKKALIERNEYINQEIKRIDLTHIKTIIREDLKNVKKRTKKDKKISTKFMNKLQRWVYSRFIRRLEQFCEISGVHVYRTNPAFTSQTCSRCGNKDKKSRKGEKFTCTACNLNIDADYNASVNVLMNFLGQENMVPVLS